MKSKFYLATVVIACLFMVSSCKKNVVKQTTSNSVTLDASSKTEWTYFSFATKSVVNIKPNGIKDVPEGTNWDIAFLRTSARVNCGVSGKGKGGVMMTDFENIEDLKSLPSGEFVVDVLGTHVGMPNIEGVPMNEVLSKWAVLNTSSMPPAVTLSPKVFVIRCADGVTYAKIKFLGYTNDEGRRFYPTFDIVYPFK